MKSLYESLLDNNSSRREKVLSRAKEFMILKSVMEILDYCLNKKQIAYIDSERFDYRKRFGYAKDGVIKSMMYFFEVDPEHFDDMKQYWDDGVNKIIKKLNKSEYVEYFNNIDKLKPYRTVEFKISNDVCLIIDLPHETGLYLSVCISLNNGNEQATPEEFSEITERLLKYKKRK